MSVGFISMVLRWITDWTCSPYSQICRATSDFFSLSYAVVFFFMLIVGLTKAKQIKDFVQRVKKALQVLSDAPTAAKAKNH